MHVQSWKIHGGGFHFGEHGLGQEETSVAFHSDSLFAALIAALAEYEGQTAVQAFIQPFLDGSPPFLITSTFPFAGGVRFFPRPELGGSQAEKPRPSANLKKLKKIRYVSQALFKEILAGAALAEIYPQARPLQGGQALASQQEGSLLPEQIQNEEDDRIWQVEQRPRVTLGRRAQNSAIYSTGRVGFAQGCGLWFGVRWLRSDPGLEALLARLLDELSISGLGAERKSGFGNCEIEPGEPFDLPDPDGGYWTTLSRYLPRDQAESTCLRAPGAAYSLKRVGGWLTSPVRSGQRRRSINLIAEGAILGPLELAAPGQMLDVRPKYQTNPDPLGHPVYRSGLAFPVGLQKAGAKEGRS